MIILKVFTQTVDFMKYNVFEYDTGAILTTERLWELKYGTPSDLSPVGEGIWEFKTSD